MKKLNKKGQVAIYLTFIISAIVIVMITAVFAPMGVLFNTEMYRAGEDIMLRANSSISQIQDQTIKDQYYAVVDGAVEATTTNIEVNSDLFKYAWILVLILSGIIFFLATRRLVEYSQTGFI